jgi:phage terminase large subunit
MTAAIATLPANAIIVRYEPLGAAEQLFKCRDREVLDEGPAGTGKTYGALQKAHLALIKYPGARGLLLRKTLVSLKASTLVTFRERVLHPSEGVRFWTSRGSEPAHYAYPNGSKLIIAGMDKASKVLSTEYDLIIYDEATEGTLEEWETLMTRLRYGKMPYQQAIALANPAHPTHWLNERANAGKMTRLLSRHTDNPALTPEYLKALGSLTGPRRARLFLGQWVAADGTVYEGSWDAARNLVDRRTICDRTGDLYGACGVPREWPRYLTVDFGFTHPFCAQWWAEDPDGRLWMYREIYHTKRLVEDHVKDIMRYAGWRVGMSGRLEAARLNADPLPRQIITDHAAEERATFERHIGRHVVPAHKAVAAGIQAVAARLKPAGDGKARLFLLRDSVVERDASLMDAKQPTCTAEEVDSYVWDTRGGQKRGEQPVKECDHGLDSLRYAVAYLDLVPRSVKIGPQAY